MPGSGGDLHSMASEQGSRQASRDEADVRVGTSGGRQSLERRLFGWLLAFALVPGLLVVAGGLGVADRSLDWFGTLGPWSHVAESGRQLFEAIDSAAVTDPAVADAVAAHRAALSESLTQAGRWRFVGGRIAGALPLLALAGALLLAVLALAAGRHLARGLARPIRELVVWSGRMAKGERLPEPSGRERREVAEFAALRAAMRRASAEILAGRERELEAERTRSWGEMARRVAHEMRNPLTPMRLATHRLAQFADTDADVREAVEVLEEESARLDEMAKQFALLGRPAPVRPSEVDVTELVAGLLSTDVPSDVTAILDADGSAIVEADHEALVRVFRNLLRNAVESVRSTGGPGSIDVRVTQHEAGVEVVVSDTGRGLPDGVAERIFEPDFTLKPGGTGLGLAVVRQVVAAHGGRVLARDRVGGGAEFVVRLPQSPRVTEEGGAG